MNPAVQELLDIIKALRGPNGCPWDKEQTFQSLTPYIIEEAYELIDAIEAAQSGHFHNLKEELGDVLLHVVMLSAMAQEQSAFDFNEVAKAISEKMIRRHPHVFSDTKINSVDEVWKNWDAIKKTEHNQPLLASIPKHLPALMRAYKMQKKASKQGFDWPTIDGPFDKLQEEIQEIKDVLAEPTPNPDHLTEEMGDLLFSVVNVARKLGVDPEKALTLSNEKFIKRFNHIEKKITDEHGNWAHKTPEELNALWEKVKE